PAHPAGVRNAASGAGSSPAKLDGAPCDDGSACTQTDACEAGICVGANPVACTAADHCHTAGACNPATGVCSNPAKLNGAPCDDGNACTPTDTCPSGICVGTKPTPGTPRDGGLRCPQTDRCARGSCVGTNRVAYTAPDQCHAAGACNPATGVCSNPPKPTGAPCDDGNACTRTDTCAAGICVGTN